MLLPEGEGRVVEYWHVLVWNVLDGGKEPRCDVGEFPFRASREEWSEASMPWSSEGLLGRDVLSFQCTLAVFRLKFTHPVSQGDGVDFSVDLDARKHEVETINVAQDSTLALKDGIRVFESGIHDGSVF